jgi:hypothetical protein
MDHPVMCGRLRLILGGGCGAQDRTEFRIEKADFSLLLFRRASYQCSSMKDLSSWIAVLRDPMRQLLRLLHATRLLMTLGSA